MERTEQPKLPAELERSAHNKDERFAAAYLGVAVNTIRGFRVRKIGPPYRKIGSLVRYSISDLAAWVQEQPAYGGPKDRS